MHMRVLRGGKIFEIERVVGWIVRIPEQNGAMNRSVGCNNQSVKRGKAIVGDNMQHSIEQKCRSGARANFYLKRCMVGRWPRVGEICILERVERKFKVVCEQASDYALAWPSESSFLFLIFLFFSSRLFLFAFSFPLISSLFFIFFFRTSIQSPRVYNLLSCFPFTRFDMLNWNHREQLLSQAKFGTDNTNLPKLDQEIHRRFLSEIKMKFVELAKHWRIFW